MNRESLNRAIEIDTEIKRLRSKLKVLGNKSVVARTLCINAVTIFNDSEKAYKDIVDYIRGVINSKIISLEEEFKGI